jgi:hypothetical protein
MPFAPSRTMTALSVAASVRYVSSLKSWWPGVQEIEDRALVFELQHGRRDRDPAALLDGHPVRGRVALCLTRADRAGLLDGAAVEEELFREGRLSRVGVGNDRKGAPAGDFAFELGREFG